MKKVENVLWQAVDWVLYLSMIIMVIVTFANVIGRYVFNHSIAAADEIARMAFVWLTYIGSIVAMKEGTHIRVDIVVSLVPPAVRKVFDIISNLLVDGIADAVRASDALKIYICNIMTQDGETEGMTASDHVKALLDHSGPGLVDLCLCNSAPVRPGLVERYREEDAAPIVVDRAAIEALGVEAVTRPLASETLNYARHSFARLAEAVMELYNERADTKIF